MSVLPLCVLIVVLIWTRSAAAAPRPVLDLADGDDCDSIDRLPDDILENFVQRLEDPRPFLSTCRRLRSVFAPNLQFYLVVHHPFYGDDYPNQVASLLPLITGHKALLNRITVRDIIAVYDRLMLIAGQDLAQRRCSQTMLCDLINMISQNDFDHFLTGLYLTDDSDPERKISHIKMLLEDNDIEMTTKS